MLNDPDLDKAIYCLVIAIFLGLFFLINPDIYILSFSYHVVLWLVIFFKIKFLIRVIQELYNRFILAKSTKK